MINKQQISGHTFELREKIDYYKTGKNKRTTYLREMFFWFSFSVFVLNYTTTILFSICFQYLFYYRKQLDCFMYNHFDFCIFSTIFLKQVKTKNEKRSEETLTFSKVDNYIYIYIYIHERKN